MYKNEIVHDKTKYIYLWNIKTNLPLLPGEFAIEI